MIFLAPAVPGYEAVYSNTNFPTQNQNQVRPNNAQKRQNWYKKSTTGFAGGAKSSNRLGFASRSQEIHYCEVCRISCAGTQVIVFRYIFFFFYIVSLLLCTSIRHIKNIWMGKNIRNVKLILKYLQLMLAKLRIILQLKYSIVISAIFLVRVLIHMQHI
jgi:hypothetical protein